MIPRDGYCWECLDLIGLMYVLDMLPSVGVLRLILIGVVVVKTWESD